LGFASLTPNDLEREITPFKGLATKVQPTISAEAANQGTIGSVINLDWLLGR